MSSSEVADLIAALRDGQLSTADVAERFRQRAWPVTRRTSPATYADMAGQQDVDVDVAGSYDEVTAAYDRGDLTSDQYRLLSEAVAEAIDAGRWREGPGGRPASPGALG